MNEVIIVGGGIAGLTAALHLAGRGIRPLLLEADERWIGGRLQDRSVTQFEHQGEMWSFAGEHGVHGLWSPYSNLRAMLSRLDLWPAVVPAEDETWIRGEGERVQRAKIGRLIRRSWVPAPIHYLHLFLQPSFLRMLTLRDFASLFRVAGGLFAALSLDPLAEQRSLQGMSLADFTEGWSPTMRSLFAGLARNGLAAQPEAVPAAGFIAFLRFYTLMRRDAWAFSYLPAGGGTAISKPLADCGQQLGSTIKMGARVTQLTREGEGWRVHYEQAGQTAVVGGKDVILAVDAPAARALLLNSPATAEAASGLRFPTGIPTAIIRFWFGRCPKMVSEAGMFSGDFVMDNFFWLERLQTEFKRWHEATGGSAVEMHIYGSQVQLAQPDAVLLAQVLQDTYRAFPHLRGSRLHMTLQRNEAVHTLFNVYPEGQHLSVTTPWPHLWACGDWVYHSNPALYLERAVTTAMVAANQLLEARGLAAWPIAPHPAPEPFAAQLAYLWGWVRRQMQ